MRLMFLMLAAAMGAATLNASSQEMDGNFFLRACGAAISQSEGKTVSQEDGIVGIYCIAYVAGFLDSMTLTTKFTKGKPQICVPERGVSINQTIRLLVKYLRDNPATLHESGRMSL